MNDLQTLVRHLLANFRTILLPAEALPGAPISSLPTGGGWPRLAVKKSEYSMTSAIASAGLCPSVAIGSSIVDCQEPDPDGGWRLHIFVLDEDGLALLDGIDDRRCEPGDPVDFDPKEFVIERLRELEWFEP